MPTGKCKGCGKLTNSATSNWWFAKNFEPTECYMAFDEKNNPVKGCAFEKADPHMKKWVLDTIKKNPWQQPKLPVEVEEGE